jgi:hypothetical protein
MEKIGVNMSMMLGGFTDFLWVLAQLFLSMKKGASDPDLFIYAPWFTIASNYFVAFTSGIGSATIWVAQGKYISDCATENTKGFYYGYFWAYYMASQVSGNLVAALVFDGHGLVTFYCIMGSVSLGTTLIFFFLKKPVI